MALASLDGYSVSGTLQQIIFQSTRLSRASTNLYKGDYSKLDISIHKALMSLDVPLSATNVTDAKISIHKALTGLDRRRQLPSAYQDNFNPNLYILIIHLQQIIQQVKKFSRILILFSSRLQCESPWNFMCNYYSHQSFLTKINPLLNYLHYPYVLYFPIRSYTII